MELGLGSSARRIIQQIQTGGTSLIRETSPGGPTQTATLPAAQYIVLNILHIFTMI